MRVQGRMDASQRRDPRLGSWRPAERAACPARRGREALSAAEAHPRGTATAPEAV